MVVTNIFLFFGFLLGTVLGSLSKALADRAITNRTFWGHSNCEKCKKNLKWFDLIPIVSYLSTNGKCRYCQDKLSMEYLLIEILMGLLISLLFLITIPTNFFELNIYKQIAIGLELLLKVFSVSILAIVFITDLKTGLIYDRITFPSIALGFIILLVTAIYNVSVLYISLILNPIGKYLLPPQSDYFFRHVLISSQPLFLGILAAFLMLLFFGLIIVLTKGRGMGGGDLKYGIFLGLVLGFPNALLALMLAFLTGSIVGVALLLGGKKKFGQSIPFGPFLSLGALITLFYGNQIMNWYLNTNLGLI